MTRKHLALSLLTLTLFAAGLVWAGNSQAAEGAAATKAEIVKVVEASYVHGAFNEQNTEAMRQGFHPIFKIHGVRAGKLSPYPIEEWIAGIEKRKAAEGWQPQTWEHRIPLIDVTGDAAVVKIELFRVEGSEKKHVYTDYLSLLKLEHGWKITDKVYHQHKRAGAGTASVGRRALPARSHQIKQINALLGLHVPTIVTPLELKGATDAGP